MPPKPAVLKLTTVGGSRGLRVPVGTVVDDIWSSHNNWMSSTCYSSNGDDAATVYPPRSRASYCDLGYIFASDLSLVDKIKDRGEGEGEEGERDVF